MAEDINPPELSVNAVDGFVEENSPVGARVKDSKGKDIKFVITDKDRVCCIISLHLITVLC